MSAQIVYSVVITCDACQQTVRQSAPTPEGLDVEKYRRALVGYGWKVADAPGKGDFCPKCVQYYRIGEKREGK